jgi:predicted MFS family arabinose efflux permease
LLGDYGKIPPQAKLLIYVSFVPSIAIGLIYTDLSYFLTSVQGFSDAFMGLVLSGMAVTEVLASVPLGILADRYGRRKMLMAGDVSMSLSLIIFAITKDPVLLFAAAVAEGLGEAAFAVSGSALLADISGDAARTPAFSLLAFIGWVAGALGGFAISVVLVFESFGLGSAQSHLVLYLAAGLSSMAVAPLLFKIRESRPVFQQGEKRSVWPKKSSKVLIRYGIYSVLIALGAGLFVPLMSRWFALAYGVTDAVSGPVLGVSSVVTAAAILMAPALAKKMGIVKAVVVSQASSTIFMLSVPLSPTFGIASSIYTMRVFLMNLSNPLTQSIIMGLVVPEERGAASGISASLWRLPNSLSVNFGAAMMGMGLLALPFYIATVMYAVGIAVFWLFFRRARMPEEIAKAG